MAATTQTAPTKPAKAEVVMYAEEGCVQLDKPWINGKPQCATMLFADVERTKWMRVVHHHCAEGALVESWDSRPNIRVTWATAADLAQSKAA